MRKFPGFFFPKWRDFFLSACIGVSAATLIYLWQLQRNFFSLRYTVYWLAIALAATFFIGWFNHKLLSRLFCQLSKPLKIFSVLFSLSLGALLLMQTHFEPFYFLLPDAELNISLTSSEIPDGAEGVRLLGVRTKWGYEHYTRLQIDGDWIRDGSNILFSGGQAARIRWQGRVGPWAEITFRHTPYDRDVEITWDGRSSTYNLANPERKTISIMQEFPVSWIYYLPYAVSFLFSAGYTLFCLLMLLGSWHPGKKRQTKPLRYGWLAYMLPMLAAWFFTLLVFWPGSMSPDSMAQWGQAINGNYDNWQPAFHTIVISFLMRIWYSPAIVALTQIFSFALVAAWGFKILRENGAPPVVLWIISFMYALSPINNIQNITLWKDILYAVALLWMTILMLQLFLSEGASIRKTRGWAALGIAAFFVAIFRKNGFPVAFFSLMFLPFIFRRYWKQCLGSLLLAALLFLGVNGPFYTLMNVRNVSTGQTNLVFLHHIAAHVNQGTPLKLEEQEYLESFLALEDWYYSCCNLTTISYEQEFERAEFLASSEQNRKLAVSLFLRAPLVDIAHNMCASDMVWRFANNQCIIKTTHAFGNISPGKENWILPNNYGVQEDPVLPVLVRPYLDGLRNFGFWDETLVEYLRPALWLYVSLFCLAVLVIRRQDLKGWVAGLPVIGQSGLMFLITFAPKFRYHYSILLVGFFTLGLLFISDSKNLKQEESF